MKRADYLGPGAVLAAMIHLAIRPTWVSAAAFAVAVLYLAAERVVHIGRAVYEERERAEVAAMEYRREVAALRAEVKHAIDAVKVSSSQATMAKRSVF